MQNERIRVYVWEWPVRFTHWIIFLCIISFSFSGYYIGRPYLQAQNPSQFIMSKMRLIHMITAYVFLMCIVIRIYWGFVGNRYASFKSWVPHTGRQWRDMADAVRFYLFARKAPPYSVGHSSFSATCYLIVYFMFFFMIFTGFALYSLNDHGLIITILGGWLKHLLALQTIRQYHHFFMYVIWSFFLIHIYFGWYLDARERNGIMGSILGGYKFVSGKEWE